ncbi:MAG: type II toxin-antitoxin system Phd/YefM family antitoxin [Clostridia bacterium]|nr:type II toxin-antitoxin system Phd/YefM family antitoxin [Clostridia bacterium]
MLEITATEFKTNFGHYLDLVPNEDIWVTRNGKYVVRLVNPNVSAVDSISGILKGKISDDVDRHTIRDERMSRYAIDD